MLKDLFHMQFRHRVIQGSGFMWRHVWSQFYLYRPQSQICLKGVLHSVQRMRPEQHKHICLSLLRIYLQYTVPFSWNSYSSIHVWHVSTEVHTVPPQKYACPVLKFLMINITLLLCLLVMRLFSSSLWREALVSSSLWSPQTGFDNLCSSLPSMLTVFTDTLVFLYLKNSLRTFYLGSLCISSF